MFYLVTNSALYIDEKTMFSETEIKSILIEWNANVDQFFLNEEETESCNVDQLFSKLLNNSVVIFNDQMVERGDEAVELVLCKTVEELDQHTF